MNKRYFVAILLLLGFLLTGCDSGGQAESGNIAEVNGDVVTREEFNQHMKLLKFVYENQVLGTGKLDESEDKEIISQIEEQTFKEMVLQKLLWQEAEKQDIKVEEAKVDSAFQDQYLKTILKETGMDEKYLRQEMKTEMLYWQIRDKITANINVDEEEAQKYYQENISQYTEPGGIKIAHILVETENEARDILAKIKDGGDFSELARRYSTCPSKEQGGDLGVINKNSDFVTEFKEPALKLQPGELTEEPIKSEFGFHIIKAGEKVESRIIPFEEAKNPVIASLEKQKKDEVFDDYLKNLNEKAEIKDLR
jgi:parvulin-like peptidyl-prolyl isomerase